MGGNHHYAIDAAKMVDKCRSLLHSILDEAGTSSRSSSSYYLMELSDALKCIDRLVHTHLLDLLDREMEFLSTIPEFSDNDEQKYQFFGEHKEFPSLMDTIETLQTADKVAKGYRNKTGYDNGMDTSSFIGNRDANGKNVASGSRISRQFAFGSNNNAQTSIPMHRRRVSTPPSLYSGKLSIDDPVEDDESDGGLWYFGDGGSGSPPGRCSPPPPMVQNNKDSRVGTSVPTIQTSPTVKSGGNSSGCGGNSNAQTRNSKMHRRNFSTGGIGLPGPSSPYSTKSNYYPSRSAKDSSLFRLIVTLQLCWVRIEEANSVLCKGRAGRDVSNRRVHFGSMVELKSCSSDDSDTSYDISSLKSAATNHQSISGATSKTSNTLLAMAGIGCGVSVCFAIVRPSSKNSDGRVQMMKTTGKIATGLLAARFVRKRWRILCMNARVADSTEAIEDWILNWICLVHDERNGWNDGNSYERKYIKTPRKQILWYSSGSLRFQLMKRGMDLLYASFGKAVELTRVRQGNQQNDILGEQKASGLWVSVVAALAASYYNVIGPAAKSAQVVSSSSSSVIQSAWGVVSLPAVKKASLEATRILKGASIADRVDIFGVSCFVLSRDPFPELATALRKVHRQESFAHEVRLCTIHEQSSEYPNSANVSGIKKKDVILHLTGGGFFAHTIAGDLPYLLDWSASTNAVVVIPEYALLPHHRFPDAITEIVQLYTFFRTGHVVSVLGFQPDRIIVSGESVGGNLAAALCVAMTMDDIGSSDVQLTPSRSLELVSDQDDLMSDDEDLANGRDEDVMCENSNLAIALPDSLIICCPVLNMTLESTSSRIAGSNDPVLPSGLVQAISDSYLPTCGEYAKTHPVASPYFAPDSVLQNFPPTLIFSSDVDPFLDDAVNWNARLRRVGVKSYLRAVHNMPHAFWALATAGIPEARQAQSDCKDWLYKVLFVADNDEIK